jgi:hypothetical protein
MADTQSNYENKMYKKALKEADGILKKHPDNGETLAMKGLIVFQLDADNKADVGARVRARVPLRVGHVCASGLYYVCGSLYGVFVL